MGDCRSQKKPYTDEALIEIVGIACERKVCDCGGFLCQGIQIQRDKRREERFYLKHGVFEDDGTTPEKFTRFLCPHCNKDYDEDGDEIRLYRIGRFLYGIASLQNVTRFPRKVS